MSMDSNNDGVGGGDDCLRLAHCMFMDANNEGVGGGDACMLFAHWMFMDAKKRGTPKQAYPFSLR